MQPIRCLLKLNDAKNHPHKFIFETQDGSRLNQGEITESPYRWKPLSGHLSFKITTHSKDIDIKKQDVAVSIALRSIGLEIRDLKFKRIYGDEKADVNIEFTSNDPLFYKGSNVLAFAYLFTPNSPMNGVLKINDNFDWRLLGETFLDPNRNPYNPNQKYASAYLIQVLMHELLHILGYRHDELNNKSVLWPYANGVIDFIQDGGRMLVRLYKDYGNRMVRPEIKAYFLDRILKLMDFD
ncbi:MAG: matrixin family metalloprotease [Candidatus Paceibacterota bacterium]